MAFPGPASASTPDAGAGGQESSEGILDGVSVRPMRLKVLYTFDDQNKTNCLARWPSVLNIQTVYLDEATAIGVIELKTCIQAIVSASPELVAKLGQDYTVYAFDYSEYETPLVGQGMLSWALASASPTPDAPAHQSRTVITGRVCKNILGLFSNGVKETLEVKLRLVPVPTCLQSEYLVSMEKYRELSKVMPSGFDAGAWTSFLQANPGLLSLTGKPGPIIAPTEFGQRTGNGAEFLSEVLSPGIHPSDAGQTPGSSIGPSAFELAQNGQAYGTAQRTASPAPSASTPLAQCQDFQERPSRVSSRASMRKSKSSSGQQSESQNDDDNGNPEDGPSKKRAKLTRAEWNGKGSIGTSTEPLRVAASTAASMRLYRPIAMNPVKSGQSHLAELPRAPTPRPQGGYSLPPPSSTRGSSRRDSSASSGAPAFTAARLHAAPSPMETAAPTPNETYPSNPNTPVHFASSPPVMQDMASIPSSPNLPALRKDIDSGFMSGNMDDLFEDDDEMRPLDEEDLQVAAGYSRRKHRQTTHTFTIEQVNPGPPDLLPKRMLPRRESTQAKGIARSNSIASSDALHSFDDSQRYLPASKARQQDPKTSSRARPQLLPQMTAPSSFFNTLSGARPLAPAPSTGSLTLPSVAASDPILPPPSLQRAQTWAAAEFPKSDMAGANDSQTTNFSKPGALTGQPRSGSGAKRRKAIQKKLQTAIQSGEMPPYCENCGAIETPTWRKAWRKIVNGSPDEIQASDEEGGILAIVRHTKDEGEEAPTYSILKRSLLQEDDGFTEIQLCNRKYSGADSSTFTDRATACGLWLNKFKCMRPEEKWNKEPKDPNDKKKRTYRKRTKTNTEIEAPSEANPPTADSGTNDGASPSDADDVLQQQGTGAELVSSRPGKRRASSLEPEKVAGGESWNDSSATAALRRAIQSSPARLLGTATSPIDIDGDYLGATRRILFPSPNKNNSPRALQEISANKPKQAHGSPKRTSGPVDQGNKENQRPTEEEDDEIMRLFEDDGPLDATTPTRKSPMDKLFRTPSKSTGRKTLSPWKSDIFSTNGADPLLPPRTPSTRSRTPRSQTGGMSGPKQSPFTAHLHQILSEANMSPSTHQFDFTSLEGMLPTNGFGTNFLSPSKDTTRTAAGTLHLPDFDAEDVFSTDVPMPSSPPAFFALYEDPVEPNSGLWSDYNVPDGSNSGTPAASEAAGNENEKENPRWSASEKQNDLRSEDAIDSGAALTVLAHSTV
ncbi:MAG: hypothetical protein M4579_004417 [Chaenotheca gracillima]|nr:MAG: hypothetical protein M4579_004417 [Chaenotheca gracillima]